MTRIDNLRLWSTGKGMSGSCGTPKTDLPTGTHKIAKIASQRDYDGEGRGIGSHRAEIARSHRKALRRIENTIDWLEGDPTRDSITPAATTPGLSQLDDAARKASRDYWENLLEAESDAGDLDAWYADASDHEPECARYTDLLPEPDMDEDIDPACGGWGTSLDYEGWYGFHVFVAR